MTRVPRAWPQAPGGADTIFALSSGLPPAAVAVVRVSGPAAGDALLALGGRLPVPRRATVRRLRDPRDGVLLDEALLLWFPGPASATGEDLAELHLHGGRAVVAVVSNALRDMPGVRAAAPGEFTRRAFVNGRMDLAAVEGLADLLAAETEAQRRSAMAAAGGAFGREVERWRITLLDIAAQVEAALDFADDEDVMIDPARVAGAITALAADVDAALARPSAERLREGLRVVIAGPPNAGKSTLLNALAGRDAAIVSPCEGTTRDRVEVPMALAGIPFVLIDTAGLRGTDDQIEVLGIARTAAAIAEADILLWLGDHEPPWCAGAVLRIHARADLPERSFIPAGADVVLSVPQARGLAEIVERLVGIGTMMVPREGEAAVTARQRALLRAMSAALAEAGAADDMLIVAEGLRSSQAALDAITGRTGVEDMLDRLFGSFCIGK